MPFAEAKSQAQLEHVPVRRLYGNKFYCLAAMLAHNLRRELQMKSGEREFGPSEKRRPLWTFETLKTIRQHLVQRAARLIRPQGRLTLVMGAKGRVREESERHLRGACLACFIRRSPCFTVVKPFGPSAPRSFGGQKIKVDDPAGPKFRTRKIQNKTDS